MSSLVPAGLLALALGSSVGALRCLAEHLLISAAIYAVAAAGLAAAAAKVTLDAI
jgi:hypothetical protein